MRSSVAPVLIYVLFGGGAAASAQEPSLSGLLAADAAFSEASASEGFGPALERFAADDVIVPLPGGRFAHGAAGALEALVRGPFTGGRVTWSPVRGGISADGTHGFTFGYVTVARPDSAPVHAKYMSYWELQGGRWRVRAYKRALCEAAAVTMEVLPASRPEAPPRLADAAQREQDRSSLVAAESAFSDAAQRVGLGEAFRRFGRADAANMGPPDRPFLTGTDAIAAAVGAGTPTDSSPVVWAADHDVIVSPAGDLGITFGVIRRNGADEAAPGFAFFTIWRRPDRSSPWRYIAE